MIQKMNTELQNSKIETDHQDPRRPIRNPHSTYSKLEVTSTKITPPPPTPIPKSRSQLHTNGNSTNTEYPSTEFTKYRGSTLGEIRRIEHRTKSRRNRRSKEYTPHLDSMLFLVPTLISILAGGKFALKLLFSAVRLSFKPEIRAIAGNVLVILTVFYLLIPLLSAGSDVFNDLNKRHGQDITDVIDQVGENLTQLAEDITTELAAQSAQRNHPVFNNSIPPEQRIITQQTDISNIGDFWTEEYIEKPAESLARFQLMLIEAGVPILEKIEFTSSFFKITPSENGQMTVPNNWFVLVDKYSYGDERLRNRSDVMWVILKPGTSFPVFENVTYELQRISQLNTFSSVTGVLVIGG